MSVLNLPRIHLSGEMLWNPDTCNNSPGIYNENTLETTGTDNGKPVPHEDYVEWLAKLSKTVPVGQQALNGSWNVYGDATWWFRNVQVTGVQTAYGQEPQWDPICMAPVKIIGERGAPKMVDVAPYQSTTTQLFHKGFKVGTEDCGFTAVGACRMYLRWSMFRNLLGPKLPIAGLAGVIFQTSARAGDIQWHGVSQSKALQQLQSQAEASPNQGVALQFAVYLTEYYKNATYNNAAISSPQDLAAAYASGFKGGNPAQSQVMGTIGVWGENELASAPTQILLNPAKPVSASSTPLPSSRAAQEGMITAESAAPAAMQLGPAMAQVTDPATLSVSFLSTILETDLNLTKENLGPLVLQVTECGSVSEIATIPYSYGTSESGYLSGYDLTAYQKTAGILDLPITSEQYQMIQAGGTIQLIVEQQGTPVVALAQEAWVVETDQRGEYLDQGEEKTFTVSVYKNGQPAPDGNVTVAQYYEDIDWADPNSSTMAYMLGESAAQAVLSLNGESGPAITVPVQDGKASFSIAPRKQGEAMLGFFPVAPGEQPATPPKQLPSAVTTFYAAIRCLGWDNDLIGSTVDWEAARDEVLELYNLVYPAMSQIFPLTDEQTIRKMAKGILARTDPDLFDWTGFMPVSREMSAGKRWVLQQYCKSVKAGS